MSSDEQHVALPKLVGAPAYARPSRPVEPPERPVDPDDLPIEVDRSPEEQALAARIVGSPYAPTVGPTGARSAQSNGHASSLQGRPFRLRALTDRLFGGQ